MLDLNHIVFLIGGNDLEMCEIRNILTIRRVPFIDKKLKWDNAVLSHYKECLTKGITYYGVELTKDIETDCDYISIDHHNYRCIEKSSLEQVADFLDIELTREQKLIVANDKGYINGMKAMGASDNEVISIRKRDRVAQGARKVDEENARLSIENNLEIINGVTVVRSLTGYYSCITDRLYPYGKLLIYDNETLVYYGYYINRLVNHFHTLIEQKRAYYGGSLTHGYFGLKNKSFSEEEMKIIKKSIMDIIMDEQSFHIFMYPFSIQNGFDTFHTFLTHCGWSEKDIPEKNIENIITEYNERQYFHNYAHKAVFPDEDFISKYEYDFKKTKNDENWIYRISLQKRIKKIADEPLLYNEEIKPDYISVYEKDPIHYDLNIQKITLTWYKKFGVCIFGFHLCNDKYADPEDVLLINQYGRRLYPPFLDIHSDKYLDGVQKKLFPLSIEIFNQENTSVIREEYSQFSGNNANQIDLNKKYIPAHIFYFFKNKLEKYEFRNILNDRMFVISWYGAKQLTYEYRKQKLSYREELKDKKYVLSDLCKRNDSASVIAGFGRDVNNRRVMKVSSDGGSYGFKSNDFWYQYVFVDSDSPSCTNTIMRSKMIEEHTYSRWVEYNTLYGISRYSFVGLTQPIEELGKYYPNSLFLIDHMKTLYYEMVSLVLAQRAIITHFYSRIAKVQIEEEKEGQEIETIYRDYRIFLNKIQNSEVSSEDQGIELYDMLMEHTRVKIQALDLEKRIQEMFRLQEMVSTNRRNRRANTITVMSSLFAIFSLFFGLMSSHYFKDFIPAELTELPFGSLNINFLYTVFGLAIVSVLAVITVFYWKNKNWGKRRWIYLISAICSAILFLAFFVYKMNLWIIAGMVLLLVIIIILSFFHKNNKRH